MTWDIEFPVVTNRKDLKKGDKSCMKIIGPKKKDKDAAAWKRDVKSAVDDAAGENKRQKTDTKKNGDGEVVVRL